jgi:uncharacterized protein (TIGR00661 family)
LPKIILYGVLNWGLGHATRSLPLIKELQSRGHKIIIAADGQASELLKKELPGMVHEELPGYNIRYSESEKNFNSTIIRQIPHILRTIEKENQAVKMLVQHYKPDVIVSDHRYGFFHPGVASVFVAHQLHLYYPQNKPVQAVANFLHRKRIEKFDRVWIPDLPPPDNLSGILSNIHHKQSQFIGPLSRFVKRNQEKKFDICVILSGPEPQRSILEKLLKEPCEKSDRKIAFVRGVFNSGELEIFFKHPQSRLFNHCTGNELNLLIEQSDTIICRAGYSSVMDLTILQKRAVLIPTPGLPEQNYLADYLKNKGWFYSTSQDKFDLETALKAAENYHPPVMKNCRDLLLDAVKAI